MSNQLDEQIRGKLIGEKNANKTGKGQYSWRYFEISDTILARCQQAEVAKDISRFVGLRTSAKVLDVPCGSGRFSIAFHRLGHRVTGMDLSEELIEYAKVHNPGPNYLVGDMREPPDGKFNLIVNLFSSFGVSASEADDRKILKAWHSRLEKGGYLVIETTDVERSMDMHGKTDETVVHEYGDCRRSFHLDSLTNILMQKFELDGVGSFVYRMRLYTRDRMVEMLQQVGFVGIEVFGSFKGANKRPENRAIFVAQRGA